MDKIERIPGIPELGLKRCYLPFAVTSDCPKCGKTLTRSLLDDTYLGYPKVGAPSKVYFYHEAENDEEHEWQVTVIFDVTLMIP